LSYRNISPVCGISPAEFRTQLEWLQEHGWQCIPLSRAVDYVKGRADAPEKSYALTFEDAFLDHWVYAVPLLREFGIKAAFTVVTAFLHDGPCRPDSTTAGADLRSLPMSRDAWARAADLNDPSGFMNSFELRILTEEHGHELVGGTHTRQACFTSDRATERRSKSEADAAYVADADAQEDGHMYPTGSAYAHDGYWQSGDEPFDKPLVRRRTEERIEFCLREFILCRERLEDVTGQPARVLAWPWGEFDEVAVEMAALAGYEAALGFMRGPNDPSTNPFAMCRVRMQGGETVRELGRRMRTASSPTLSRMFRRRTGWVPLAKA
jgi:peptidoglycan/xylan/chitin deacetylase (PgdA/CDA1 family)